MCRGAMSCKCIFQGRMRTSIRRLCTNGSTETGRLPDRVIGDVPRRERQPTALQFRQLGLGYCFACSGGAVSAMKIPGQLWGRGLALCHHAEGGKLGGGKFLDVDASH